MLLVWKEDYELLVNSWWSEVKLCLMDTVRASVAIENANLLKYTDKCFAVSQGHPHLEAKYTSCMLI